MKTTPNPFLALLHNTILHISKTAKRKSGKQKNVCWILKVNVVLSAKTPLLDRVIFQLEMNPFNFFSVDMTAGIWVSADTEYRSDTSD